MQTLKRILFLWLFFWPLWGPGNPALHAEEIAQEYQLKAAFLVNFAKFITWPESALPPGKGEFILCVAGADPFGQALAGIESKTIGGRPIRVVRVDSLKKVPPCHLLFVSRSETSDLGQLATFIGKQPVVTVSDIPGFATAGGQIEFLIKANRLSFSINHTAMKKQGLYASTSLLELAVAVQ